MKCQLDGPDVMFFTVYRVTPRHTRVVEHTTLKGSDKLLDALRKVAVVRYRVRMKT